MHRRVRTVVVGNVGKLQGNIPLLPDAKPDDGILDVVVIATRNVLDWARVGGRVLRRADVPDRRMERFTGKHVLIEASHTQPRQLDVEPAWPAPELNQVRASTSAAARNSASRRARRSAASASCAPAALLKQLVGVRRAPGLLGGEAPAACISAIRTEPVSVVMTC